MPYSRAWAFNRGAREARGNVLVFHDNDILAPAGYGAQVARLLEDGWEVMRLMRFLFYLGGLDTRRAFADGRLPDRWSPEAIRQNCDGGSLAVARDAYFAMGGHDEGFLGWGGEDNEFLERCRTRQAWTYGFLPFAHLDHPRHDPAVVGRETLRRLERVRKIAPEARVAALAARPFGHPDGPRPLLTPRCWRTFDARAIGGWK
jgi:hypothetical protein